MIHIPEQANQPVRDISDIAKELGLESACPERSRRDPSCDINTPEGKKAWNELEAELAKEAEEEAVEDALIEDLGDGADL